MFKISFSFAKIKYLSLLYCLKIVSPATFELVSLRCSLSMIFRGLYTKCYINISSFMLVCLVWVLTSSISCLVTFYQSDTSFKQFYLNFPPFFIDAFICLILRDIYITSFCLLTYHEVLLMILVLSENQLTQKLKLIRCRPITMYTKKHSIPLKWAFGGHPCGKVFNVNMTHLGRQKKLNNF